jgi:glutamine synthetase
VRSITPDANPYLTLYTLLRTGLEGPLGDEDAETRRSRTKFLSDNTYDAIRLFKDSQFVTDLLGDEVHTRYADVKLASAEPCPKAPCSSHDAESAHRHDVASPDPFGVDASRPGAPEPHCAGGQCGPVDSADCGHPPDPRGHGR